MRQSLLLTQVALHELMWNFSDMVTMNVTLNINEGNRTLLPNCGVTPD